MMFIKYSLSCWIMLGCLPLTAVSQVVPDRTLGEESSRVRRATVRNREADLVEGGARRGQNLFHSFREFGIREGDAAYFASPAAVENIFSRVTGSNPSNIFGTLGVDGAANLYFMNPNGILFGPNASLDLGGSFVGTTASAISFGEQQFSATDPAVPSRLLSISPSAFFLNQLSTGNIVSRANLQVPDRAGLTLLGGNVTIQDGSLNAAGGRIEVGGAAAGRVDVNGNGSLAFVDDSLRADVLLDNTIINVRSDGAGNIGITGNRIDIENNSAIRAGIAADLGTPESQAGDIRLEGNAIRVRQLSRVANVVLGTGNAGDVRVRAGSVFVTDGAAFNASTFGQGRAGNVIIEAEQVRFDGFRRENEEVFRSGAFSNIEEKGRGRGGNVIIRADSLSLTNGAQLSASTFGHGSAGNVVIDAGGVSFDGTSRDGRLPSAAFSTIEEEGRGQGGNVTITADSLSLTNGAQLVASTRGVGRAGNVIIEAGGVSFDGTSRDGRLRSAAFSTIEATGVGQGGNVEIRTNFLSASNRAVISSSTLGQGDAGDVIIEADQIRFDDVSQAISRVEGNAKADDQGERREGGNIEIRANSLLFTNGGRVDASTLGNGDSGNVIIHAERVSFDGVDGRSQSGARSTVGGERRGRGGVVEIGRGRGGVVEITTGILSVTNGARIVTNTFGQGRAGNIVIDAERATFEGASANGRFRSGAESIAAPDATGRSGNIEITANAVRLLNGGSIRTDDNRSKADRGGGGNIRIDANYVLATNGSDILAFSNEGQGGNIDLPVLFTEGNIEVNQTRLNRNQQNLLDQNDRIDIDASGQVSGGAVNVVTPDTSAIQNSLADLSENAIDPDALIANSCIARTETGGTFLITGTGGLPTARPDALPPSAYPTDTVRTAPDAGWQPGDPIVEPQGVYQLPNDELVLSHDCRN